MQILHRHRGADPEDARSFGDERLATLRQASRDLCWLLDHGYGLGSATELVGDRHHLTRRQRIVVGGMWFNMSYDREIQLDLKFWMKFLMGAGLGRLPMNRFKALGTLSGFCCAFWSSSRTVAGSI